MIYFGKTFTAKVSGSVWKEVKCEACQCEYVYRLTRTGRGSGSAPYYIGEASASDRAQRGAVKDLQKKLERGCDAVACPECGVYQTNMVRMLRRRRWGWLHVCGWVAVALAVLVAWIAAISEPHRPAPSFGSKLIEMPMGAILGAGVAMIALSWIGRSLYDPNATAAERVQSPERTPDGPLRRAEFEAMVNEVSAREKQVREQFPGISIGTRVHCPHCNQTFATISRDRCPLCYGDWAISPPRIVG